MNHCGTCTLCCKVMAIRETEKPAGRWCDKCDRAGGGCTIYDARPQSCRDFACIWLQSQDRPADQVMPPELRPDRCRVVLDSTVPGPGLVAHVDPGYPDAWKRGVIGAYLGNVVKLGRMPVIIAIGQKRHAFLPGKPPRSFVDADPGPHTVTLEVAE